MGTHARMPGASRRFFPAVSAVSSRPEHVTCFCMVFFPLLTSLQPTVSLVGMESVCEGIPQRQTQRRRRRPVAPGLGRASSSHLLLCPRVLLSVRIGRM